MPRAGSGGPEGQWKLAGGVSHRDSETMFSAPVGARENDRHAIGTFSAPLARRVQYQRPDSRIAAAFRKATKPDFFGLLSFIGPRLIHFDWHRKEKFLG
jgi:hypothetical protein